MFAHDLQTEAAGLGVTLRPSSEVCHGRSVCSACMRTVGIGNVVFNAAVLGVETRADRYLSPGSGTPCCAMGAIDRALASAGSRRRTARLSSAWSCELDRTDEIQ